MSLCTKKFNIDRKASFNSFKECYFLHPNLPILWQSVAKIIETHYIFIKIVHKKTLDLLKVTQNPLFPLTQCCIKPEEAIPGSEDQKWEGKFATNIE